MNLVQINLQSHFGGGEIYTAFLTRAFSQLGFASRLLVNAQADFWARLDLPGDCLRIPIDVDSSFTLPASPLWLLSHGPLPKPFRLPGESTWRTAIAHMPVQGRDPAAFCGHDCIFPVSGWVRDGLLAAGLPAWEEPLYGVADLEGRTGDKDIRRTSRYDWDRRKGRDRLLGVLEPLIESFRPQPSFARRTGLTLAIVSRLTPIKQFPLLFAQLAPVLARHPTVNLEIFGSGGFASVRDFDRALAPCRGQVRFWGQQADVGTIYSQIDYLLAGLPEKEALGLNIIESQACGTPVLAVDAPPFSETVVDGVSGYRYRDPRQDGGADFGRLLGELLSGKPRPDPRSAVEHMRKFSFDAFLERLRPVVAEAQRRLNAS